MPYKLTYFDARGAAEEIRMLFALAEQEYEDKRVSQEEWKTFKETTPFEQLPILEVDGTVICQSKTIARFIAKKYGFYGKTEMEQARTDMLIDCVDDALKPLSSMFYASSDEEKAALKKKYGDEQLPKYLKLFEKMVGSEDFVNGKEIGWADIAIHNAMTWPKVLGIDLDEKTIPPKMMALYQRVKTHPKIAAWIEKRPQTEH